MPLNTALKFTQYIDGATGLIEDITPDYGIGGNPIRGDIANYLIYSYNDKNNGRTYYDIVNSSPLSQMNWSIITDIQGWTQATLFHVNKWYNNIPYVDEIKDIQGIITRYASIIYYEPTNKIYKAIEDHINVAPDSVNGSIYWEEVLDLTSLLGYTTVTQFTEDFQVDFQINKFVTKGFINIYNSCGCSADLKKLEPAIQNWALYLAATANFQNESPEKMDVIIEHLNNLSQVC